jgi:hypothetical protein
MLHFSFPLHVIPITKTMYYFTILRKSIYFILLPNCLFKGGGKRIGAYLYIFFILHKNAKKTKKVKIYVYT